MSRLRRVSNGKGLKKFVNPKFVRTCDLKLMRRLLARHATQLKGFEPATLDGDPEAAREALRRFLEGSENNYPSGLKADLHLIEALGNRHGMRLLIERAKAEGVDLEPRASIGKKKPDNKWTPDPKYLAILCFLDHRSVFDAASDPFGDRNKGCSHGVPWDRWGDLPNLRRDDEKGFRGSREAAPRVRVPGELLPNWLVRGRKRNQHRRGTRNEFHDRGGNR
jgi:hypothetical protein